MQLEEGDKAIARLKPLPRPRSTPDASRRIAGRRLSLTLEPIVPARVSSHHARNLAYGFQLRLKDGPLVLADDPLLTAFGSMLVELDDVSEHDEMLQHAAFDPGRELDVILEPGEDLELLAVWDKERLRRAGTLPCDCSDVVRAGRDHGLTYTAVSIQEERTPRDHRRRGLTVLVFDRSRVRLPQRSRDHPCPPPLCKPWRRVVLVADGVSDVQWWDGTGDRGPAEIAEVPVSPRIVAGLRALDRSLADVRAREDRCDSAYEHYTITMDLEDLDEQARALWLRARAELAGNYTVGFVGREMRTPIWTPRDLEDDLEGDELHTL
jgi:hypothetical protein